MLRPAPGIEYGDLMHAGNRAMRRTAFFRHILSPDVVERVFLQRRAGISALLRAIMHQPVLRRYRDSARRRGSAIGWDVPAQYCPERR